jgi:SpoVK/Ycf46/Vps4 family AAA+-type ATPase
MIRCAEAKYELNNLNDLIEITKLSYTTEKNNQDLQSLRSIKSSLIQLNNMVGLETLKQQIVYQILFFIQKLNSDEMMHTVLMGPPGVGKTTVAKILAKIYKQLGFLSHGKLICATREDLIGQFLGETAIKTRSVLDKSIGNVLFIDEAYSLGSGNDKSSDTYAKECVDTLTAFLSEHTKNFICIIAGYEKELQTCFFAGNPGLDRRFPWKYVLPKYQHKELNRIFEILLKQKKWKIRNAQKKDTLMHLENILKENSKYFENCGGDVQTLINCCMMAHSKRVFGNTRGFKKQLIKNDIENGFIIFKSNKKGVIPDYNPMAHMYT